MEGRPTQKQLNDALPIQYWEIAEAQALRSTHSRHKTGAVIFNPRNYMARWRRPLTKSIGCSHTHNGGMAIRSVHAEHHAIMNWPKAEYEVGCICLIVTITRNGNYASASKPCQNCASLLAGKVGDVIFAERANDGSWVIKSENPAEMKDLSRAKYGL